MILAEYSDASNLTRALLDERAPRRVSARHARVRAPRYPIWGGSVGYLFAKEAKG